MLFRGTFCRRAANQRGPAARVSCQEAPDFVLNEEFRVEEFEYEEWSRRSFRQSPVGGAHTGEYLDHPMIKATDTEGEVPPGYARIRGGRIVAHKTCQPEHGAFFHRDIAMAASA